MINVYVSLNVDLSIFNKVFYHDVTDLHKKVSTVSLQSTFPFCLAKSVLVGICHACLQLSSPSAKSTDTNKLQYGIYVGYECCIKPRAGK